MILNIDNEFTSFDSLLEDYKLLKNQIVKLDNLIMDS
jgi:hypothetical protein